MTTAQPVKPVTTPTLEDRIATGWKNVERVRQHRRAHRAAAEVAPSVAR
jgi:hypothetical protein